ncbi:MAG TPA: GMC family oxidoreductase N-terminal domain-containing protein, partial [Chlamydiales bacterium]|nr:GMC family oxidoreductase N-terminal domain-containing protein [Chlamydiales bacterium]
MTFIDRKGRRVSTETAYLTKDVLQRPNLKVMVHARVSRILFDTAGDKPRATGVEFTSEVVSNNSH